MTAALCLRNLAHGNKEEAICWRALILKQQTAGIKVDIVWKEEITNDVPLKSGFVLFNEDNKVFTDELNAMDSRIVVAGYLITNLSEIEKYRTRFNSLIGTYRIDLSQLDKYCL